MKVNLTSTTKIVEINGMRCRVWEGHTDSGIPMHAYIPRVAVANEHDSSQFDRELQACEPPSAEIQAIPLRLFLP
jgi:hypothetical protein